MNVTPGATLLFDLNFLMRLRRLLALSLVVKDVFRKQNIVGLLNISLVALVLFFNIFFFSRLFPKRKYLFCG